MINFFDQFFLVFHLPKYFWPEVNNLSPVETLGIVAPVSIASSAYLFRTFFISFQPGAKHVLRSIKYERSSNFLSVDVVGQIFDVSSSNAVINPKIDNVFMFSGTLFTP